MQQKPACCKFALGRLIRTPYSYILGIRILLLAYNLSGLSGTPLNAIHDRHPPCPVLGWVNIPVESLA